MKDDKNLTCIKTDKKSSDNKQTIDSSKFMDAVLSGKGFCVTCRTSEDIRAFKSFVNSLGY